MMKKNTNYSYRMIKIQKDTKSGFIFLLLIYSVTRVINSQLCFKTNKIEVMQKVKFLG